MIKNIIKLIVIILILLLIGNVTYGIYKEILLETKPSNEETNIIENLLNYTDNNEMWKTEEKEIELIPKEHMGYTVSSKLVIEKINLETYVFEEYNETAMWLCPTKYFGPEPNETGNYCIAAHNYNKKNMFNNIINLEIGDIIKLIDNKHGEINYIVFDVYKAEPNDNTPLSQKTEENVEITLITCSDYSTKRIIVKARKI